MNVKYPACGPFSPGFGYELDEGYGVSCLKSKVFCHILTLQQPRVNN